MSELSLFAPGIPAPQGSKRAYVRGGRAVLVESSAKVKPWRAVVTLAAREAMREQGVDMFTGAVTLDVAFVLPRPRSHFGTGRNADVVKASAPTFHAQKPDLDKLLRSTLDALTDAGVWRDDAQVCQIEAERSWCDRGETPGAWITVRAA